MDCEVKDMRYFCKAPYHFTTEHKTLSDARKEARKIVFMGITSSEVAKTTKNNVIGQICKDGKTAYWFDLRETSNVTLIKTWSGEILKVGKYSYNEVLKDGTLRRLKTPVRLINGSIYHKKVVNGKVKWYFGNFTFED